MEAEIFSKMLAIQPIGTQQKPKKQNQQSLKCDHTVSTPSNKMIKKHTCLFMFVLCINDD